MATMTLSKARKTKGLTAYALAQAVGVNRSTISRLERGLRLPMHETVVKLEKVLGCELRFPARQPKRDRVSEQTQDTRRSA